MAGGQLWRKSAGFGRLCPAPAPDQPVRYPASYAEFGPMFTTPDLGNSGPWFAQFRSELTDIQPDLANLRPKFERHRQNSFDVGEITVRSGRILSNFGRYRPKCDNS